MRLLGADRGERVDADGTAGGSEAAHQRHREGDGGRRQERRRVGRADPGEQCLHRSAQREGGAEPDRTRSRRARRCGRAPAPAPSPRVAPNAMRTPISWVREATTNDSRPWMPRQASSTAIPAKADSAHNCTERDVVSACTMSVSIRTSDTGCAGSALATAARTAAITGAGAPEVSHDQVLRRVEGEPAVLHLGGRQVDLRLAVAFQSAHPDVADHADDHAFGQRHRERPANRILARQITVRPTSGSRPPRTARSGRRRSRRRGPEKRDAHGREVARASRSARSPMPHRGAAVSGVITCQMPPRITIGRKLVYAALSTPGTRARPRAPVEELLAAGHRLVASATATRCAPSPRPRRGNRIHVLHPPQGAQEQPDADQQDDRRCDLGDDERRPQVLGARCRRRACRAGRRRRDSTADAPAGTRPKPKPGGSVAIAATRQHPQIGRGRRGNRQRRRHQRGDSSAPAATPGRHRSGRRRPTAAGSR